MKKIYFCGISGSGMSSLAQILKYQGNDVYGSDRNFDLGRDLQNKSKLEEIGIKIFPQDGSYVSKDIDFLCVSTAVEDSIPDVKKAKSLGIKIKTRPQLLAEVFHQYKYGVAIAGTSGKTTTTAMVGYILDKAEMCPCMVNGGLLKDYSENKGIPNIIYNKGDVCVVEADESNGSIDLYNPFASVITNISEDHKSLDELEELFSRFANRTSNGVVFNDDYDLCRKIIKKGISFSLKNPKADFYASDIVALPEGTQYVFRGKTFTLKLIGDFNVGNALAAIATVNLLGVDVFQAAEILQDFSGTKRRLEVIGTKNGITLIDDFAHNPDKVKASVSALRKYTGRLIVIFQPHGFGPMRSLGKEIMQNYAKFLSDDDIFVMPEIFFVGGTVTKDISSEDFINYIKAQGKENAYFFADWKELEDFVVNQASEGDRIIVMGARDNSLTDFCYRILERV